MNLPWARSFWSMQVPPNALSLPWGSSPFSRPSGSSPRWGPEHRSHAPESSHPQPPRSAPLPEHQAPPTGFGSIPGPGSAPRSVQTRCRRVGPLSRCRENQPSASLLPTQKELAGLRGHRGSLPPGRWGARENCGCIYRLRVRLLDVYENEVVKFSASPNPVLQWTERSCRQVGPDRLPAHPQPLPPRATRPTCHLRGFLLRCHQRWTSVVIADSF